MSYVPEDINPTIGLSTEKETTPASIGAPELQNPAVRDAVARAEDAKAIAADVAKAEVTRAVKAAESTAVQAAETKASDTSSMRDISAARDRADDAKSRLESLSSRNDRDDDDRPAAGSMAADVKKAEVLRAKSDAETKAVKADKVKADDKATIGDIAKADKAAADAKKHLESLTDRDDDRDSSKVDSDLTISEIADRLDEIAARYGIDPQNGKFLGSPPGEFPGLTQIAENIALGRSQRPDPRLALMTPEEIRELEDSQQLLASTLSSGIVFGVAPSIDNVVAQYAPGYFKLPAALAAKVAVGRVVNPIAQEGADLHSDWQGQPNVVPGPGIATWENVGDIAPATASIIAGSAAQTGVKATLLGGAALAGISIPEPVTTVAGLATAVYVGGKVFVSVDNLLPNVLPREEFGDDATPIEPPTIEEYEAMLAEHASVNSVEAETATVTDEVLEKATAEEIEAAMPTREQLEAIWGPKSSPDATEELETDPKSTAESGEELELGSKYPPVVLEEPAERPVAAQPAREPVHVPEEILEESMVAPLRRSDGDDSPEELSVIGTDDGAPQARPIGDLPEVWSTLVNRVKGGIDQVRDLASELPERFFASEDSGPRLIIDTRPIPPHLKDDDRADIPIFTLGDTPRLRDSDNEDHRGEGIGGLSPSCKIDLWMAPYVTQLLKLGVTDLCQFEGWSEDRLKTEIGKLEAAQLVPEVSGESHVVACTFGFDNEDGFQFLDQTEPSINAHDFTWL